MKLSERRGLRNIYSGPFVPYVFLRQIDATGKAWPKNSSWEHPMVFTDNSREPGPLTAI